MTIPKIVLQKVIRFDKPERLYHVAVQFRGILFDLYDAVKGNREKYPFDIEVIVMRKIDDAK